MNSNSLTGWKKKKEKKSKFSLDLYVRGGNDVVSDARLSVTIQLCSWTYFVNTEMPMEDKSWIIKAICKECTNIYLVF